MAQLTEREPEWIASAPVVVRNTLTVAAPAEAVWARIADHASWPEWFTDLKRVEVTDGATGVGGGRSVALPGTTMRERFTAWEPPRRFAFTVIEGPPALRSMAEEITIVDDEVGCVVTYAQGLEPTRGFGWLVKLVARRMNTQQRRALEGLAALVTSA